MRHIGPGGAHRGGIGLGRSATSGELGIRLQPPRQIDAVAAGVRHQKGRHGTPYAVVAAGDVAPARVQGLGPLAQHVQGEVEAVGKRRPRLLVRVTDVQPSGTGGKLRPSLYQGDGFQYRRDHEVMEARLVEAHEGAVRQGLYRGIADPARDQGLFAEALSRPELGQFISLLAARETALHLAQPFFDHVAGVRDVSLLDDAVAGLDLDGLHGGKQALDIGHRQAREDRGLQHAGDPVFRAARCDICIEGLGIEGLAAIIVGSRMQVVIEPLPLHAQHLDRGPGERRELAGLQLGKGESSLLGPAPEVAHQLAIRIEFEVALEQIKQVGVAVALSEHVMSRGIVQDGRLIDETLEARWRQVLKRCEPRDQGIERRAVVANIRIHFFPLGSVSGCFGAPKQWGVSAMRRFAVVHIRPADVS